MGWKKPVTPIQTDNATAVVIVNSTIIPKQIKSMDLRFWWLKCRESQQQFRYYWAPGKNNWGDYSTKHHPPVYHESNLARCAGIKQIPQESNRVRFNLESNKLDALEPLKASSQEIYSLFGYSKGVLLLYLHSVTLARALSQQRQTILCLSITLCGDHTYLT